MEDKSRKPRIRIVSISIERLEDAPVAIQTKENDMYTNRKHTPEQYYLEMRELHDETDTDWETLERIGEDTYEGWVLNNLIYTSGDAELIEALNAYHTRRAVKPVSTRDSVTEVLNHYHNKEDV